MKNNHAENEVKQEASKEIKWINCGDVNFWEYGVLVRRHWSEEETDNKSMLENEFDILRCEPDEDSDKVYVRSLYVDITDTWFENDLDSIASYCDCKVRDFQNEEEKINFAIALTDYYSNENFCPSYPNDMILNTKQDAYKWLQGFEVGDLIENPEED